MVATRRRHDLSSVLVTGAGGFVGGAVAALLERQGYLVRRAVRRQQAPGAPNIVRVEVGPATDWGAALEGIDTVVHAAAYVHRPDSGSHGADSEMFRVNAEGTRVLTVAARRSGVKTLVFLSSISAAIEHSRCDVDETVACRPETPYGRSKLEGERAIAEERGQMRAVVFRPPLVYGNGAPGNFARLVTAIRRRWPLPFGAVRNRRSFVFVGNLADAIARGISDGRADGTYHLADASPVSTPEFIAAIAAAVEVAPRLWSVPERWLVESGRLFGIAREIRKLTESLPIDTTRFRTAVDWEPPWDMRRALFESFPDVTLLAVAVASFVVSAILTYVLVTVGRSLLSVDVPNARSLHDRPTPRGAGLAILATATIVGGALSRIVDIPPSLVWVATGSAAIAVVSWLDDRHSVSPLWRLAVHLMAAALFVAVTTPVVHSIGAVVFAVALVLVIAWFTNLYNFMDGMDGFAGGMTMIGFGTLSALAWIKGDVPLAAVCTMFAAAAAGFLVFNLPPARIFLGDVGASTLGYLAATLGLLAVRRGAVSWQALALVFSPFLVDATVTLLRRLLSRSKVWQAHRTHFYQRLVGAGWSTWRTLRAEYLLMLACAITAVIVEWSRLRWSVVLGGWVCLYVALMAAVVQIERSQRRHQPTHVRATSL